MWFCFFHVPKCTSCDSFLLLLWWIHGFKNLHIIIYPCFGISLIKIWTGLQWTALNYIRWIIRLCFIISHAFPDYLQDLHTHSDWVIILLAILFHVAFPKSNLHVYLNEQTCIKFRLNGEYDEGKQYLNTLSSSCYLADVVSCLPISSFSRTIIYV